jgi:predicted transposase YbfD/YdcC
MLSLFSHITHAVLFQVGVASKENEIPAFRRLLKELTKHTSVQGFLFLADALHAQTETVKAILEKQADYLLVIKGNQKDFFADIHTAFSEQIDLPGTNYQSKQMNLDRFTEEQLSRRRMITTTVTLTHDEALRAYLIQEHGFKGIQTIGLLTRKGTRTKKDGTINDINETVGFVSSKKLGAQAVSRLLRNHWCIENNLHWVKDFVFLEDRQTLRKGNAPQVMSFLRSMAISLCNLSRFRSVADAIHNFDKDKATHYQFLRMAAVV